MFRKDWGGQGTPSFPLHHVGILVSDIKTECARFVKRYGYVIESEVIEDRKQTACVRFIRQAGALFWLELITPNGPDSKLINGLKRGGGLHHLCYEVDDLARVTQNLSEDGMMMISEPVLAEAFPGRRIAWFIGQDRILIEVLEAGSGPLSLSSLHKSPR